MSDTVSQIAALIKASGHPPHEIVAALNRAYPPPVQPAAIVTGAGMDRRTDPNADFKEMLDRTWEEFMKVTRTGQPDADPNMRTGTPVGSNDKITVPANVVFPVTKGVQPAAVKRPIPAR